MGKARQACRIGLYGLHTSQHHKIHGRDDPAPRGRMSKPTHPQKEYLRRLSFLAGYERTHAAVHHLGPEHWPLTRHSADRLIRILAQERKNAD